MKVFRVQLDTPLFPSTSRIFRAGLEFLMLGFKYLTEFSYFNPLSYNLKQNMTQ